MPFEEFYRQNFKTVYGFLINLCKNSDLAEELTAEIFGKKETWVRVTYYRAKVRLLERLGDDNE